SLLSPSGREPFLRQLADDYREVRERHAGRERRETFLPFEEAIANRFLPDWSTAQPTRPPSLGVTTFEDYPIAEIRDYIDWSPFFIAWEMRGKYPRILDDPDQGETARRLFDDANRLLDRIVSER